MDTATKVEVVFAHVFGQIFVAGNTGGFQSFRRDLFDLIRDDVHDVGELTNVGLFVADVIDADLGVRHTSVVPRLRVRLASSYSVASGWSSAH